MALVALVVLVVLVALVFLANSQQLTANRQLQQQRSPNPHGEDQVTFVMFWLLRLSQIANDLEKLVFTS